MNVKFTADIAIISHKKGTSKMFERDVIFGFCDITDHIFLSFSNFSLILELATQFIFKAR